MKSDNGGNQWLYNAKTNAIKTRAFEEFSRVRFYVRISSQCYTFFMIKVLLFSNPILARSMFNEL
uniref:Uncharacterized protein n=1 Tax=Rhizophagus irregularis (strain DAOM 181602 / DAOM 197198 / MUCL 43194) TaxID=747089 RepID=U9TPP0_RHIID